jgi:hypothetical protein
MKVRGWLQMAQQSRALPPEQWSPTALWHFLYFWEKLPVPKDIPKRDKTRFRQQLQSRIRNDDKLLQLFIKSWENRYKEIVDDRAAVRSRGANLLPATGVIAGVVALVVPVGTWVTGVLHFKSVGATALGVLVLIWIALILYCGVAATFLAIRAQEVSDWGSVEMFTHPPTGQKGDYDIEYCCSLYVASRLNRRILDSYVRYLNDAQLYFRLLVMVIALLVISSLAAVWTGQTNLPLATK